MDPTVASYLDWSQRVTPSLREHELVDTLPMANTPAVQLRAFDVYDRLTARAVMPVRCFIVSVLMRVNICHMFLSCAFSVRALDFVFSVQESGQVLVADAHLF